jgi:peptidoglycan/xylan/chitin deacetylase (PgdA/CDA1 family)
MMSAGRLLLLGGTVGVAAGGLGLVLAGPPLAGLACLVPIAYLGLLCVGAMNPRLSMFASIVCQGPPARPEIALTFDDGPHPTSTRQVLAALAAAGARATFFVLGAKAQKAPDVLREMTATGHELGVHGDTHDRLLSLRHPDAIAASFARAGAVVEAATGARPHLCRPPLGHVSPRTAVAARRLGLVLVGWSVRSRDGRASTTAAQATRRVLAGLRPGAIVLMHDAAERDDHEPVAATALPTILDEIARRGWKCVTLSELLRA